MNMNAQSCGSFHFTYAVPAEVFPITALCVVLNEFENVTMSGAASRRVQRHINTYSTRG